MKKNIFKFPDLADYDLKKPGEMALYNAHSDFFGIEGLIDTSYANINYISELLSNQLHNSIDDIEKFGNTQLELAIYNYRVIPMVNSSILLIIFSMLEEAIFCLCRTYHLMNKYKYTVDRFPGSKNFNKKESVGINRYILYLENVVGLKNIKDELSWQHIDIARKIRNLFVHNGGRFQKKHINNIELYEKYGFYKDENTSNILFDETAIKKLYKNIMIFLNDVFKKEIDS